VSTENVRILKRIWEEWSGPIKGFDERREFFERCWHPEIVYDEDPRWPGAGTYSGRDAVIEAWEGYLDAFGEGELLIEDLIEAGERLVTMARWKLVSVGAVPTDHVWAYVSTARDGKLVHLQAYWDPAEALASVGLESA
jgi:ketosteroid isomerase-like protein